MKIKVCVQGDYDVKPVTNMFHYNELIFLESAQLTKNHLLNNMRLNINETLSFFVAFIIISLKEGKAINEIQNLIPELLLPHQVMIGVPEGLRRLVFTIMEDEDDSKVVSVATPIRINQYFLHERSEQKI